MRASPAARAAGEGRILRLCPTQVRRPLQSFLRSRNPQNKTRLEVPKQVHRRPRTCSKGWSPSALEMGWESCRAQPGEQKAPERPNCSLSACKNIFMSRGVVAEQRTAAPICTSAASDRTSPEALKAGLKGAWSNPAWREAPVAGDVGLDPP